MVDGSCRFGVMGVGDGWCLLIWWLGCGTWMLAWWFVIWVCWFVGVFASKLFKILVFSSSKSHFIYFNHSFYNTSNVKRIYIYIHLIKIILHPSHFFYHLFHFDMSQNIVLFLKIKVINLLIFLLYLY